MDNFRQGKWESDLYDSFADLYAIIMTTDKLEKAYVRDLVSSKEYEQECFKLIVQFRTLASSLPDNCPIERIAKAYKLDCPAALKRLIDSGVPATVEHRTADCSAADVGAIAAHVAQCVQHFITAMDSVKLNMVAVDQVFPLLMDLNHSLAKLEGRLLPPVFEGRVKVNEWIVDALPKMSAADELSEDQARQLLFDLESAYNTFMAVLPNSSG